MLTTTFGNIAKLIPFLRITNPDACNALATSVVKVGKDIEANLAERDAILTKLFEREQIKDIVIPLERMNHEVDPLSLTDREAAWQDESVLVKRAAQLLNFNNVQHQQGDPDVHFSYEDITDEGKKRFFITIKNSLTGGPNYTLTYRNKPGHESKPLVISKESPAGKLVTLMRDIANKKLAWGQNQLIV